MNLEIVIYTYIQYIINHNISCKNIENDKFNNVLKSILLKMHFVQYKIVLL
jgi:hypothetical protein